MISAESGGIPGAAYPNGMLVLERLVRGAQLRPASAAAHTNRRGPLQHVQPKDPRPASASAQISSPSNVAQPVFAMAMGADEEAAHNACRGTLPFLACDREKAQGIGFQAAGGSGPQHSSIRAVSYTTQDRHVPTFAWSQRPQSPGRQQSPLSNTTASLAVGSCRSSAAGQRVRSAVGAQPSTAGARATSAGAGPSTAGARSVAGDCRPSTAGACSTTAGGRSTFGGGRASDQDDLGAAGTSSPMDISPWQVHQGKAGSRPTTAFFRSLPRPTTAPTGRTCAPPAEATPACTSSTSGPVPSLQLTRPRTARGSIRFAAQTPRPTPVIQSTWPGPGQYNSAARTLQWVKPCAREARLVLGEEDMPLEWDTLPWLTADAASRPGSASTSALLFLRQERRPVWHARSEEVASGMTAHHQQQQQQKEEADAAAAEEEQQQQLADDPHV